MEAPALQEMQKSNIHLPLRSMKLCWKNGSEICCGMWRG